MDTIIDDISGSTRVYGILGYPVGHSFSPVLQNTLASKTGINLRYLAFPVAPQDLGAAIKGGFALGVQGFNVTVPHKQAVIPFLCGIDPLAEQIGAVNTLKRTESGYIGYNTDILGLERAFALQNVELAGKNLVVLGAGGAAHAAVVLAQRAGAKKLYLVNRTLSKAEALAERIQIPVEVLSYDDLYRLEAPDILIQTTSVGMGRPEESPVADAELFRRVQVAMDLIYAPWQTKFLKDAAAAGCKDINGFDMLIYQGIASFELWNEMEVAPEKAAALRNLLEEYYRKGR